MSQQQLGRRPLRTDRTTPPEPGGPSETARFVGWLGSLGCAAAGYGVFQFLFGVLPDSLGGQPARYLVAGVSGIGTGVAAWLAAALPSLPSHPTNRASSLGPPGSGAVPSDLKGPRPSCC